MPDTLAQRLVSSLVTAGVAVESVSIGTPRVKATYIVSPATLQSAAEPTIVAFDDSLAAETAYAQQQQVKAVNAIFGVRKTADESTSNPAFVDCADLKFTLAPNASYYFRFEGGYTTALATTGLQISVTGPSSPTFLAFAGQVSETATTVRNGVGGSYDVAIAALASAGATAMPFWLSGSITTGSTGGVFTLRMRTEVNGSAVTIKRGSVGQLVVVA